VDVFLGQFAGRLAPTSIGLEKLNYVTVAHGELDIWLHLPDHCIGVIHDDGAPAGGGLIAHSLLVPLVGSWQQSGVEDIAAARLEVVV